MQGPALEPVTLAEIKRQARIDADIFDEDDDLEFWITAARQHAEEFLRVTLIESTWRVKFADFPRADPWRLELPMGHPLIAVESLTYLDNTGTERTLDGAEFQTVFDTPPYLLPLPAHCWPATNGAADAVVVQYRAGYLGAGSPGDASGVPALIRQGIRMLAAAWYENRETMTEKTKTEIAYGFERALAMTRILP